MTASDQPPAPAGDAAEAEEAKPGSLLDTYKSVFLSGLATILPTILTFWVLTAGYDFIDRNAATPINDLLKNKLILGTDEGLKFAKSFWDLPLQMPKSRDELSRRTPAEVEEDEKRREAFREEVDRRFPPWIGFVLAIGLIFVVGFFIASFIGRTLWQLMERVIMKIPIVKSVYPSAKQMVEFMLANDENAAQFNQVVAVEYPSRGQWTLGLVTGQGRPEVRKAANKTVVTVFIPMAPTPITGFVVFYPKDECIELDMTVDEALRFYISGGVIGSLASPELEAELKNDDRSSES